VVVQGTPEMGEMQAMQQQVLQVLVVVVQVLRVFLHQVTAKREIRPAVGAVAVETATRILQNQEARAVQEKYSLRTPVQPIQSALPQQRVYVRAIHQL
jgi:hypothetical protein